MRAGYYRTMEYVQRRLEQRGFGDVRPAHMMIFQHLQPEGSRVGELAERAHLTNQSSATWSTTSSDWATLSAARTRAIDVQPSCA